MMRLFLASAVLLFANALYASEPLSESALAERIDALLDERLAADGIQPAPAAEDAEFLRRVSLDLSGRIPRVSDARAFFADESSSKRQRLIDDLLDDPRFAIHFANLWRAELLPETAADRGAGVFRQGFEAWLIDRARAGVPYDALVRELIAVPIAAEGSGVEPALRDPARANPVAFFAVKEAKPENLAAALTRTFLGLRMECAQCHDHPFATWTQEQFWQQAAFFGSVRQQGTGMFAPLVEASLVHSVTPAEQGVTYEATFLDGGSPPWVNLATPRAALAKWITSRDNPYFARAGANRIWAQFFGRGLVEPIDDFRDDNPPSHRQLLEELAAAFAESGFNLKYLMRAICLTQAYQRTSTRTDSSQDAPALPARMPLKSLTGEQFFDSIALATGYEPSQDRGNARRQFLVRFARGVEAVEPETSVQQALTLMNGQFLEWASTADACPTLVALIGAPGVTWDEQLEGIYLAALSRLPTSAEREHIAAMCTGLREKEQHDVLADVFWALLASAEFRMNH